MRGKRAERERDHVSREHWRKRWNKGMEKRGMSVPFIEKGSSDQLYWRFCLA